MKSSLWIAAVLLASVVGVLSGPQSARAGSKEEADELAARRQEVWDTQVKYAGIAVVTAGLGLGAFWLLSNSDKRKKQYKEELRKQDKLDPNEGMPIN